jgi:hypothetical protein
MAVVMTTGTHTENLASLVPVIKYQRLKNTYCFEVEEKICVPTIGLTFKVLHFAHKVYLYRRDPAPIL